jgi:hypothetical protein
MNRKLLTIEPSLPARIHREGPHTECSGLGREAKIGLATSRMNFSCLLRAEEYVAWLDTL